MDSTSLLVLSFFLKVSSQNQAYFCSALSRFQTKRSPEFISRPATSTIAEISLYRIMVLLHSVLHDGFYGKTRVTQKIRCFHKTKCWLGYIKAAMNEGSEVEFGCFSGCKLRPGSKPSSSSRLLNSCLLCWAAGV